MKVQSHLQARPHLFPTFPNAVPIVTHLHSSAHAHTGVPDNSMRRAHARTRAESNAHTLSHSLRGRKGKKKGEKKRNRSPGIAVRVGESYLVKIIYYPHPRLIDAVD